MMTIPKDNTRLIGISTEDKEFRTFGVVILEEQLDDIDVLGTGEGVASDTNAEGLTETDTSGLGDGLVCQRAGARDDTDLSRLMDVSGLDTHLAAQRVDDTGAVRSDQARFGLALERVLDLDLCEQNTAGEGYR